MHTIKSKQDCEIYKWRKQCGLWVVTEDSCDLTEIQAMGQLATSVDLIPL